MDALKAQFDRVLKQLSGLTASQKMLVGTLVAVMALTVGYWGKFAGNPEMVPVLDQQLSDEDIGPITRRLDLAGVPHSVVSGKVLVPADRKAEILADLMYSQDLPRDTHWAFEEMTSKELNPFSSQTEREAVYNHATEIELTGMIRRWPGVADARVVVNAKNERHIGESTPPTATVDIHTRKGGGVTADPKQLVQAAVDGVAGAVSGLTQQNIRVIVDGASMRVPGGGEPGVIIPADYVEMQAKKEAALERKVRDQFSFIPGLTVTVTCDIENQSRVEDVHQVDKAGAFAQADYEHNQNTDQHSADPSAREPGPATNDGTAALGGPASIDGGGGSLSAPVTTGGTTSDELTHNQVFVPTTDRHIITPAGKATVVAAAVNVPMSYVARLARAADPAAKDPSPAEMQRLATVETAKLREQVALVVGLTSDKTVSVQTFADDPAATAEFTLAAAAAPNLPGAPGALAGHAKEIGIGVLALVSLGMMFQMARRSTGMPQLSPAVSMAGLGGSSAGRDDDDDEDDDIRDAVGATTMPVGGMEGMELDADQVRTQQMLDQVSTLVQEDPDAAAALVKRWVSRA
jgi:flagellar biosynthesis/type III secretory pathway M-ring protein FliF/YscJ